MVTFSDTKGKERLFRNKGDENTASGSGKTTVR